MNKVISKTSLIVVGLLVLIGGGTAFAANKIGTVTGNDGDVKDKVQLSAEVVNSDGSHVTLRDTETGKEYQTSFGPSRYSGTYNQGDTVSVEGVETIGENDNGHNFQATKVNDITLRESFEGKPAWAGQGNGSDSQNSGTGTGLGQGNGNSFMDKNSDGTCDNLVK